MRRWHAIKSSTERIVLMARIRTKVDGLVEQDLTSKDSSNVEAYREKLILRVQQICFHDII